MKVVALISGGKDSTFNMMKCVEAGHKIVALANLHPPADGDDELDSYMYQSVGQDAIEAYAKCMDLPLYRAPITGKPVNVGFNYEPTPEDEVEDLYNLLVRVKREIPDVLGVSSGAILSSYQKNRVEDVCARLGLVSLAYLWQVEQRSLLQSMIDSGLHAIIIKVAAYGLDYSDLGKSLQQLQPKLERLADEFGSHICGEGGEFESLTLDCPLFRKRLVIDKLERKDHPKIAAGVSYLKVLEWHVEDKEQ